MIWYWLSPILFIVYIGMAFLSGPIYVHFTQEKISEGSDIFIGYTVAAVTWPVCLPVCLVFCALRSTGNLWNKYAKFLEKRYKKHHEFKTVRDYY